MVDVTVTELENVALVVVTGRIDSMTAGRFGVGLSGAIEKGFSHIVLDLAGVDYMSSAGLREIVNALKKVRREKGDLRIAQPSSRVFEVLEMAGLDTVVQIFETQAEALGSY
jgi:anti-sigma B factor antagonist